MTRKRTPRTRATLAGWWKWIPFVALPFALFFSEAWVRTGILVSHFEMGQSTVRMREVQERIQELRGEESHLRRLSRIDSAAPDLGLIAPVPGQVIVVELRGEWSEEGDRIAPLAPLLDDVLPLTEPGLVAD